MYTGYTSLLREAQPLAPLWLAPSPAPGSLGLEFWRRVAGGWRSARLPCLKLINRVICRSILLSIPGKKSASWQLGQLVADLKAKILVVVVFRMFSLYDVYLSILTKPGCLAWNWFDRLIQYLLMYLPIYQFIYLSIFLPGELGPALGCRDVKDVGLGHRAGQLGRGPLVQPTVQLVPDTLCIRRYG